MITKDKRNGFKWGFGTALVGIALAWLLGVAHTNDQQNLDALANLHAKELAQCWSEIEDEQVCKIEYIKDRTDTVIGAKVTKEAK